MYKPRFDLASPFPDREDYRIDEELEDEGHDDAADHRRSKALHDVRASTVTPHDPPISDGFQCFTDFRLPNLPPSV